MKPLTDYVRTNSDDAAALAAYLAQPAEGIRTPIQTVKSWIAANKLSTPLKRVAANESLPAELRDNVSEFIDGLLLAESFDGTDPEILADAEAAVPALQQVGVFDNRLAGDFLAFVRVVPAATLADAAAARLSLAKSATLVAAEAWISSVRAAVLFAVDAASLPSVPAPIVVEVAQP